MSFEGNPENQKSNLVTTGFYVFGHKVVEIAKNVKFSNHVELEITSVNKTYLHLGDLYIQVLRRGFARLHMYTQSDIRDIIICCKNCTMLGIDNSLSRKNRFEKWLD